MTDDQSREELEEELLRLRTAAETALIFAQEVATGVNERRFEAANIVEALSAALKETHEPR
jgi:hypothetical protein